MIRKVNLLVGSGSHRRLVVTPSPLDESVTPSITRGPTTDQSVGVRDLIRRATAVTGRHLSTVTLPGSKSKRDGQNARYLHRSGDEPGGNGLIAMVRLLLATFGVGFVSALVPLVNMETYVVGVGIDVGIFGVWTVAITAAGGQTLGKAVWYEFGRTSMRWGYIQRKMDKPAWKRRYAKVKSRVDDRPWVGMLLLFASATLGFPPLVIMAVSPGR
jgi:membrane protein YqaA with SNARE-associated domain